MVRSKHEGSYITLKDTVSKMIEEAIVEVEVEIEAHNRGIETGGTLSELVNIQNQLGKMKVALSPKKFLPSYWRIIVDAWPSNTPLGNKLLELANKYEKLD